MAKEKKEVNNGWEETLLRLDKKYGKGSVIQLGSKTTGLYDVISTGSIAFDNSLGIGGVARGRMYEMQGWEGTGKTTICGEICANFQAKYPNDEIVYIDAEHGLDRNYFDALGVDTNKIFISQPYSCEEGFNVTKEMLETGRVGLVIIDSDTALKPLTEVEGEAGDSSIGKKARLNSQNYPTIKNLAHKYNACVIIISQFREKIGVMFGSPITTSGGNALKFTADVILEVSKTILKDGEQQYANETKIKIKKNKMAPPFRACSFEIVYGKGIDKITELISIADDKEVIKKWGASITYNEIKYPIEDFNQMLQDNPEFKEEIITKIKEKL